MKFFEGDWLNVRRDVSDVIRENTHSQVLRCHVVVQIRDNELVVDARRPSSSWSTPILNSIADRTRNVLDLVVYPHTVAGTRALEDKNQLVRG